MRDGGNGGRATSFWTRFAVGFPLRFADLHFGLALVRSAEGAQECGIAASSGFGLVELVGIRVCQMYPPEQLFIWRVDALRKIVENPTEENLFASAAFLRQLLLDGGGSLIHQANRNIRLKFDFIVVGLTARPNPNHPAAAGAVFSQISIAPHPNLPMVPQRKLSLDDFLKQEVVYHQGHAATVRQVIKYVANKAGAVHKENPNNQEDQSLEDAAVNFQIFGMPSVLQALKGVAEVVITACEPLYQRLRA
jgi:hypothetical protein